MVIATPPAPTAPAAPAGAGARLGARRRPGEFGGTGRKFTPRRKVCQFCVDKVKEVDYKDLGRLRRFLSERGKIEPRRKTGTCAAHQRSLNVALKRARHLALLPFTAEHIRITGMPLREPGAPRGPRLPRPPEGLEPTEAPAAEAGVAPAPAPPVDGAVAAAAPETNGAAPPPSPESPQTVAQSPSAQGTRETPLPPGPEAAEPE